MNFGLSEPQRMLRDAVAEFARQQIAIERVRTVMETGGTPEHRAIFAELAEQGVTGLLVPEQHGGAGLGLLDGTVAAQELGRAATPISFHSSCTLAALLIAASGSEEQQARWLGGLASGETLFSVAIPGTSAPGSVEERDGKLYGSLPFVADALDADLILIGAGERLFAVAAGAGGLERLPLETIDQTRRVGDLDLDGVEPTEELPGGLAAELRDRVLQAARIVVAADTVGACYQAIDIAVEYAKERQQFGRVIGSFQAVKHLCAEMIADLDPVQSLLWYAAWAWDEQQPDAGRLAALLKAHASEVGYDVVTKATQVFGGMGFTWECDMHLFFKRVGYNRQVLGAPEELRVEAAASL